MHISLANKSALVTGSARGIGRAIAKKLLEAGASVLLADVDETALQEAEAALGAQAGNLRASRAI